MRFLFGVLLGSVCFASAACAKDRHFTLMRYGTRHVRRSFDFEARSSVGMAESWKITKRTYQPKNGPLVSLVSIDNGRIRVDVIPSRGMSLLAVYDSKSGARILGWDSRAKDSEEQNFAKFAQRRGFRGPRSGFNECLTRCGVRFDGHPGVDEFHAEAIEEPAADSSLHGRLSQIPATVVELTIEDNPVSRVRLYGMISPGGFAGPYLRLASELVIEAGSSTIELHDVIRNREETDQQYQLIYHTMFGAPIVDNGAVLHAAIREVRPMNEQSVAGLQTMMEYGVPLPDAKQEAFLVEPYADAAGNSTAVLHNADADLGVQLTWAVETLPYLTVWKNKIASVDGYVTGIEPATGFPFSERVERAYRRIAPIKAGGSKEFHLSMTVLNSSETVSAAIERVPVNGPTNVISTPPNIEFEDE